MLLKCIFHWREKCATEEEMRNVQALIGFSFGGKENGYCKSNKFLANIASAIVKKYNIAPITQWEISELMWIGKPISIEKHRISGKYLDSYEVAKQAEKIFQKNNWGNIAVLAHPDHAWRCAAILKKMEFNIVVIDTSNCPYDSESDQKWTRAKWLFIPREILVRIIYFLQGKI